MPIISQPYGGTIVSPSFRNQWLNFSLYFIQFKYLTKRNFARSFYCSFLLNIRERLRRNDNPIGGRVKSNQYLINGQFFKTDFIKVEKSDIVKMLIEYPEIKGYTYPSTDAIGYTIQDSDIKGSYKSKITRTDNNQKTSDSTKTFYRGLGTADCLQFLVKMNLI